MGEVGRRRVEDVFAWSRIAERVEALYSDLTSRRS
jgi:glycosyltransferase involved in cell wall biosynthesis